jgi:hypothetical protein
VAITRINYEKQIRIAHKKGAPNRASAATHQALRSRPRPRFLAGGVLEYWSIAVLQYCAFSELRPRSGLEVLSGRVLLCDSPRAEGLSYDVQPLRGKSATRP